MARNSFPTGLTERQLDDLAEKAVACLADDLAEHVFALPAPGIDDPAAQAPYPVPALNRLRILAHLSRAIERRAHHEATSAAQSGAGYPQLGEAWYITRQGARRRWPGLVFATHPSTRPLPGGHDRNPGVNTDPRTYSVLLVEDDDADAALIDAALNEHGMARDIHHVHDGVEALQYLRASDTPRPDLIVLDLNMPRMNGRELLAVLKDDENLLSIPIVVLTTSSAPDDISAAYHQHANAYVTKPINLDDFLQAVRSIDAFFLEIAVAPRRS
ncbi:response regulator [Streptosporangium sp. V21-05]|uniref:response regulator n=1 Tax=Streptosporangium sp. V21-05 TaxID=3446115 RepID=UPI003F539571